MEILPNQILHKFPLLVLVAEHSNFRNLPRFRRMHPQTILKLVVDA